MGKLRKLLSKLAFWKRDPRDPLVKLLYSKYLFNMLSIPREKVELGDLYRQKPNNSEKLYPSTNIKHFVNPSFEMPPVDPPEALADVRKTISGTVEAKLGLDLLENFLNILSALNLGTSIRAKYENSRAYSLRFKFDDATREHVDPFLFGDNLKNRKVKTDNPAFDSNYKYFTVMGVIRTNSISVVAQDQNSNKVDVGIDAASIADVSGGVSTTRSEEGIITFRSPNKQLALGIELVELQYDTQNNKFKIEEVDNYFTVREGEKETTHQALTIPRSFPDPNGSLFIEVDDDTS